MARPIVQTMLFMACLFTCVLVAISLPLVNIIAEAVKGIESEPFSNIVNNVRNGNAVYGVAPMSGRDGCKSFSCQVEHVAVRAPVTSYGPSSKNVNCVCVPEEEASAINLAFRAVDFKTAPGLGRSKHQKEARNMEPPLSKDTNFTYVPPPKTDITPELIAQSLAVQPQDTATVGSVMPHFQDGVIAFGVQLNGLVAATMTLNASTSLPCANIGSPGQSQPDLVLQPKDIENGTMQAYVPDCNIIAVNMYDPVLINYWVMNANGSIFSLIGNNKVMNIGRLNSTASTSLVLRAYPAGTAKRDLEVATFLEGMSILKRSMSPPGPHTALMTPEACAAMKCTNNGGKAALFNPFTKTCWCQDPVYAETEIV